MSIVERNRKIYSILSVFVFVLVIVLVLFLIYYIMKTNKDLDELRNMPLFWLTIVIGLIFIYDIVCWIIRCRMYDFCGFQSLFFLDYGIKISIYIGFAFFISVALLASKLS
jgi:hypothetical protein